MIYITQFIYIKEGQEADFLTFEEKVLPFISQYGGKVDIRLNTERARKIEGEIEKPYEIHLVSFPDDKALNEYIGNPERKKYLHLKEKSIKEVLLYKGIKM